MPSQKRTYKIMDGDWCLEDGFEDLIEAKDNLEEYLLDDGGQEYTCLEVVEAWSGKVVATADVVVEVKWRPYRT